MSRMYIRHKYKGPSEQEHDSKGVQDHGDSEQEHANFCIVWIVLLLSSKPRYSIHVYNIKSIW